MLDKLNKYLIYALKLYHEDGDYAGAYRIFSDLGDYSDSAEKAIEIASNYPNDTNQIIGLNVNTEQFTFVDGKLVKPEVEKKEAAAGKKSTRKPAAKKAPKAKAE